MPGSRPHGAGGFRGARARSIVRPGFDGGNADEQRIESRRRAAVEGSRHQAPDAARAVRGVRGSGADGQSPLPERDAAHRRPRGEIPRARRSGARRGRGAQGGAPGGIERPRGRAAVPGVARPDHADRPHRRLRGHLGRRPRTAEGGRRRFGAAAGRVRQGQEPEPSRSTASRAFRSARRSRWISFSRWRSREVDDASGVDGFTDARFRFVAGPGPGKGASRGAPDLLPHDPGRRPLDLLQGGRPEGRADDPPAARPSLVVADVRAALRPAFRPLPPRRARLPGLRAQRLAGPEEVRVHVRSHRRGHESLHRGARV